MMFNSLVIFDGDLVDPNDDPTSVWKLRGCRKSVRGVVRWTPLQMEWSS